MRLKTTNKAFTASKKAMFWRMTESVRLARCTTSIARDVAQSQIAAMHRSSRHLVRRKRTSALG